MGQVTTLTTLRWGRRQSPILIVSRFFPWFYRLHLWIYWSSHHRLQTSVEEILQAVCARLQDSASFDTKATCSRSCWLHEGKHFHQLLGRTCQLCKINCLFLWFCKEVHPSHAPRAYLHILKSSHQINAVCFYRYNMCIFLGACWEKSLSKNYQRI